jgi:hypothetical protein
MTMPSQELMERVAELRRDGRTPKEIARALGLKPAEVAPLIRAGGAAAPTREAELVGCWVTDGWSDGLTVKGHPEWPGVRAADGTSGLASVLVADVINAPFCAPGAHVPRAYDSRLPEYPGSAADYSPSVSL